MSFWRFSAYAYHYSIHLTDDLEEDKVRAFPLLENTNRCVLQGLIFTKIGLFLES